MSKRSRRLALLMALALLVTAVSASAALAGGKHRRTFGVEVAEDPSRFVFSGIHTIEGGELDGFPAYGDYFVTQGWIYPAGTLGDGDGITCDDSGGSLECEPEYPDKVIGEWTCYGVHVGEGAATETGAWVVTTQHFNFGSPYGELSITTEGFETPESAEAIRAITGGTGFFKKARGEQAQTFLGFGEAWFNVLTHNEFEVKR